jgi:hypothetical protein
MVNPSFSFNIYGNRKSDAFNWLENTMSDLKIGKKEPFTPIGVVTRNSNVFQFPTAKVPKVENAKPLIVSTPQPSKTAFEDTRTEESSSLRYQLPQAFVQQPKPSGDPHSTPTQQRANNPQHQSPQPQMNTSFNGKSSYSPSNHQLDQIQQLNQQVHLPHPQNYASMMSSQQPNATSFKQWPMRMPGSSHKPFNLNYYKF